MSRYCMSRNGQRRRNPWQARVSKLGITYFIGYFETKEAADAAEQAFKDKRNWKPIRRNGRERLGG